MKPWVRWLALLAGIGLFAVYLGRSDLGSVWNAVRGLGPSAGFLLLPYGLVYLADTAGWRLAFMGSIRVGYEKLFRIRWAGEAVNNLVPTGYVGGEAVKVLLLRREGVATSEATAAALISKTAQTVGQVIFLLVGTGAYLSLRGGGRPEGLYSGLAVVLGGGCAVVAFLLWLQGRGIAATAMALMGRFGIRSRRMEASRASLENLDRIVAGYYRARRGRFLACAGVFFLGWMLDTLEVYLAAWMLGMPLSWAQAVVLESFTGVVKVVGLWVPGALGVQESGIVLLARWVGAAPLFGPTYALLRRVRELLYAGAGWGLLAATGLSVAKGQEGQEGSPSDR